MSLSNRVTEMASAPTSAQAIVEAHAIGARIGGRVLFDSVSFHLDKGRIMAVLGPNGSGKTTLLRTLIGTRKPTAGRVIRRGGVGYVPQRTDTAFAYTVKDMIAMGRTRHFGMLGAPGPRDAAIIERSAARVDAIGFLDRTFDTLSGGERQLVLIARALASEPTVLMLDEPAAALDLKHQAQLLALLVDIARTENIAIVFTTHQPQHAAAIADDVILLRDSNLHAGIATTLLTTEYLESLFDVPIVRLPLPYPHVGRTTLVAAIEPILSR
jgi:iron complex transport system ATP-binding protein